MNKLNKLGTELLEYKVELNKDYPDLVLKSLNASIDTFASNGLIDVDTHLALKEKSISFDDLNGILLSKPSCLKTEEELMTEYEEIRNNFNNILNIEELKFVETKSSLDREIVSLSKSILLDSKILKDLFYIKSDDEFEKLMERKNFFEKFAILRLPKLLHEFIETIEINENIYVRSSNVFFHHIENNYGINLVLEIKIEALEDSEKINQISEECLDIINSINEYYNSKIIL